MNIAKVISNLMKQIPKDETRRHIHGVKLTTLAPDSIELCATDGHILHRVTLNPGCDFPAIPHPVLIPYSEENRDLLAALSKRPVIKSVAWTTTESGRQLLEVGGLPLDVTEIGDDGIRYPDVDAVIPALTDTFIEINFNPDLLKRLVASLGRSRTARPLCLKMKFDSSGTLSPVVFEIKGDDAIQRDMVMMPMKWDRA